MTRTDHGGGCPVVFMQPKPFVPAVPVLEMCDHPILLNRHLSSLTPSRPNRYHYTNSMHWLLRQSAQLFTTFTDFTVVPSIVAEIPQHKIYMCTMPTHFVSLFHGRSIGVTLATCRRYVRMRNLPSIRNCSANACASNPYILVHISRAQ